MAKQKDLTREAMIRNNQTYLDFYDRLKLLATSLFSYEGLDDAFGFGASRFLENALFEKGRAVFIKDPTRGFMVCNVNPNNKLNIYNLPTEVMAYNIGYNASFDLDDVVYVMKHRSLLEQLLNYLRTDYTKLSVPWMLTCKRRKHQY